MRRQSHLAPVALPAGAMNSPALLAEIAAQMRTRRTGDRAHVINLTLFPMTPDDHAVLERGAARRTGRDHVARLRQLPDHVDAARATSGASSTSTT